MRQATYEDEKGRRWMVQLPDGVPDSDASMGLPIGPPPLDGLFQPGRIGTPEEIEVALHNALFDRGLITLKDVKRRRQEVLSALISTLKVGVHAIVRLYAEPKTVPQKKKEAKPPAKRQTGKKQGGK